MVAVVVVAVVRRGGAGTRKPPATAEVAAAMQQQLLLLTACMCTMSARQLVRELGAAPRQPHRQRLLLVGCHMAAVVPGLQARHCYRWRCRRVSPAFSFTGSGYWLVRRAVSAVCSASNHQELLVRRRGLLPVREPAATAAARSAPEAAQVVVCLAG